MVCWGRVERNRGQKVRTGKGQDRLSKEKVLGPQVCIDMESGGQSDILRLLLKTGGPPERK